MTIRNIFHRLISFPIHTLAFVFYPILALSAANIQVVDLSEARRSVFVTVLVFFTLWLLLWLATRNLRKAAIITTFSATLFFSYGHTHILFAKESDPTWWLMPLWVLLLVAGLWWIVAHPSQVAPVTKFLNILLIVLLAPPLFTILSDRVRADARTSQSVLDILEPFNLSRLEDPVQGNHPDIYYIVLDGYAREDVLREIYGYNNRELLDFLEDRGFYVAADSYANYNQTFLSLSSSLNMAYLQELMDVTPHTKVLYETHIEMIHNSLVYKVLERYGYECVNFNSGMLLTSNPEADYFLTETEELAFEGHHAVDLFGYELWLTPYETTLMETTALRPALPLFSKYIAEAPEYEKKRQRIRYEFSHLADFAQKDGSYFIFAHILAPHPPFVFQADGQPRINFGPYSIADGSHFIGRIGTREDYIEGYHEQIQYTNTLLIKAVKEILERSEDPPVIILQADHGPGAYFDWFSLRKTDHAERMGILNAIYLPGGGESSLYASISPVNSFRVVLNQTFGMGLEMLQDRSYFTDWRRPYDFIEITGRLHEPSDPSFHRKE